MMLNENEFVNHLDDDSQPTNSNKSQTKPVREGEPMGGEKFGENNNTYAGDDKNNPSQNAGYTNEYFRRTEPAEEHPENTNFKVQDQEGAPDYDSAQPHGTSANEESEIENNNNNASYNEGTVDEDGEDSDYSSRPDTDPHLL
jgi:hypothetical protein